MSASRRDARACPQAGYQWTDAVPRHLPPLRKPQAAGLALWGVGMGRARSWALPAGSLFFAKGLERKPNTVRHQLREGWYEAHAQRGKPRQELAVAELVCAVVGVGIEVGGRAAMGNRRRCDPLRPTLCGGGGERGGSGLRDAGGGDGVRRPAEAGGAGRGAAEAAPGAGGGAAPVLCARARRSRLIGALALSAPRALRGASGATQHYRGHVSASHECSVSALGRGGA
jgi:hypothetical protein